MASLSIAHPKTGATVGIDTHGKAHVAATSTNDFGRPLGHLERSLRDITASNTPSSGVPRVSGQA
jgi:hypothetical protein